MTAATRAALLPILLLLAPLLGGCAGEPSSVDARRAAIEERLLASCSCHPKKIAGLPLEAAIRKEIRVGIAQGLDDDAILWQVLQIHGTALLEAGIEDLELRARAVLVETPLVLLLGGAALLLQLRRKQNDS